MSAGTPHGDKVQPVILTPGDPAGIAAEISLMAFAAGMRGFILMEDPERLGGIAGCLGLDIDIQCVDGPEPLAEDHAALPVLPLTWEVAPVAGQGDPRNADMVIGSIRRAAAMAQDGSAAAIVTNPINKAVLKTAGFGHPGHTEFLASMAPTRPGAPLMMLAGDTLRVVPATVRASRRAGRAYNQGIIDKGRLLDEALRSISDARRPVSRCAASTRMPARTDSSATRTCA